VDDREHQANMRCIAVPVRDREGRVMAALSATESAEHMNPQRLEEVRGLLLEAAGRLRGKLYPTGFPMPARDVMAAE
jgi:DNA-binding IclR family transcriptional regulator